MMSKKNGGVAPGSGMTQYSSIGEYQNREVGRSGWGDRGKKEGLWDFRGSGEPEKGKSFEM